MIRIIVVVYIHQTSFAILKFLDEIIKGAQFA